VRILPKEYFHRTSILQRFWQRLAYETIRVLFFLFTFYFRQEKESKPREKAQKQEKIQTR
jgi:hypothetical protein